MPSFRHISHSSSHVSRTSPMALVCVSTYIRSKDLSLPHLFAFPRPFIPIIYSYSPFRSTMRAQSFLLAFLLIVTSFLPLTFASPLPPADNKRHCLVLACRLQEGAPMVTMTPSPLATPTPTSSSSTDEPTSTPQGPPEAFIPPSVASASNTTASNSSSANAGVALASHGTLFCTLLAAFLGTVLAL